MQKKEEFLAHLAFNMRTNEWMIWHCAWVEPFDRILQKKLFTFHLKLCSRGDRIPPYNLGWPEAINELDGWDDSEFIYEHIHDVGILFVESCLALISIQWCYTTWTRQRAGRDVSHLRITSAEHCRDGIISERAAEYLGLLHQMVLLRQHEKNHRSCKILESSAIRFLTLSMWYKHTQAYQHICKSIYKFEGVRGTVVVCLWRFSSYGFPFIKNAGQSLVFSVKGSLFHGHWNGDDLEPHWSMKFGVSGYFVFSMSRCETHRGSRLSNHKKITDGPVAVARFIPSILVEVEKIAASQPKVWSFAAWDYCHY